MENKSITYIQIQQYIEGKLDQKAMHELERKALEDPFLAEALEGYSIAKTSSIHHLSLLQRQLEERVAQQQEQKSTFFFSWQRVSIAATATLLFLSASILFWMKSARQQPAASQPKHVEVQLSPSKEPAGAKQVVSEVASPVQGWKSYQSYLSSNVKIPASLKTTGKVIVSFSIDQNGRPVNLEIKEGLSTEANKEVERLIKEGPGWKTGSRPTATVTVSFKK